MTRAVQPVTLLLALGLVATLGVAQAPDGGYPDEAFQAMEWRLIGPFRGGRMVAVAGVASDTQTYYGGATGGGLWKTTDAGINWFNISDGFFNTSSVGAIAVIIFCYGFIAQ